MKRKGLTICCLVLGFVFNAHSGTFPCEKVFPKSLQVETLAHCNSLAVKNLPSNNKSNHVQFDNLLLSEVLRKNNLGGLKIQFKDNPEKIVYRSAYVVGAPLCIQSLAKNKVKTVVNLYSGKLGHAIYLDPLEASIFAQNGTPGYIKIKNFMVNDHTLTKQELNLKITSIIKTIKRSPANVLIHCYTGEHDTGVIFGVLQKCINQQPLDIVFKNAKCHLGTSTHYGRKTYDRLVNIVKQYPCDMLKN